MSTKTVQTSKVLQGITAALSLVVIGALVLSPTFVAAATIGVLEAETMTWAPSSSGSIVSGSSPSTTYLRLSAAGAIANGTINSTGTTTSLIIRAKANICTGSPQLRLSVNNVVITTPAITNESKFADYSAPLSVGVGNHSVKLELLNYYKSSTCNRNAIIDTVSLIGTVAPPPDTIAPTVSITGHGTDAVVSGSTTLTANATDNVGVTKVEFYVNGGLLSSDLAAPYEYAWDTLQTPDGPATLTAKAYDAAGLVTTSSPVTATVDNVPPPDTIAPTVSISSPTVGTEVSGTAIVAADATDNVGVTNVEFYLDDNLVSSDSSTPYDYAWDTLQAPEGLAALTAKAYDAAGAATTSTPVGVTVDNVPEPPVDPTLPVVGITSPATNAEISGTVTVIVDATDDEGVTSVEFYSNDELVASDLEAPYEYVWDTWQTADGPVTLTAKAYDAAGAVTTSTPVTATVDNVPPPDTTAPTVSITSPPANSQVSGTTNVVAIAWDNVAVSKVEFYLNGSLIASDLDAPYSYGWDTSQTADGPATLTAKAYDTVDLMTSSTPIAVTIDNVQEPTPPPYPPTDITDLTDVPYGAHALQKMDVHPATNGQVGEAVIMIHGGVWTAGDKIGTVTTQSKNLAANGFTVFNVNYRLASETVVGYPMEVEDIEAVIKWVVAYGAQYKANVQGIDMVGGSAGGHLAMLASQRQNAIAPGTISTIASLSGPTDFVAPWPKKVPQMDHFLGCDVYAQKCSTELLKEASPNYNVNVSTCPAIYLMNNTNESIPQIQADNMYNTLVAAGCVTKKNIMTGTAHSFSYWSSVETSIIQWLNDN